jgi:hypothetical protein
MKIIQLVTAVNGESPGSFESQLLGLGDDGGLYEYMYPRQPQTRDIYGNYVPKEKIEEFLKNRNTLKFTDGTTQGWQLICMSIDRPKALPHPLDPTRVERS